MPALSGGLSRRALATLDETLRQLPDTEATRDLRQRADAVRAAGDSPERDRDLLGVLRDATALQLDYARAMYRSAAALSAMKRRRRGR